MHNGLTFIWSYPLIPIGALFLFSSDQLLVPLFPLRSLKVEIWELVKMEIYGGCLHIFLLSFMSKGSSKCGPKKGHFERLDIESWNSQCRKLQMRQLFWPNLGVLRGEEPPKIENFKLLNIEFWNSQCRKLLVRQLFWPNLGILWGEGATPQNGLSKTKPLNCLT